MPTKISPRLVFAAIAALCLCFLLTAWYLQYGPEKQQPCPLCILQRYLYMGLGLVSLIGAAHNPRRTGTLVYAGIADLIASAGVALAVWQVSKGASMTTCLADPIGEFVNGLPMANGWPEFLYANGGCADKYPPILGIPVPAWSLIWFAVFAVMIVLVVVGAMKRRE